MRVNITYDPAYTERIAALILPLEYSLFASRLWTAETGSRGQGDTRQVVAALASVGNLRNRRRLRNASLHLGHLFTPAWIETARH